MLKAVQGYDFLKEVNDATAKMVMFDGLNKYTIIDITEDSGKWMLSASSEMTKDWVPGRYSYQVLDQSGIAEQGAMKVQANLLYSTEIDSFWRKALKAVEDRIAGKAIDPANDISVGDKRISYLKLDELMKLRDFILQKIAEEEQEEGDEEASSKSDQKRIYFAWSPF